ncbi:LacI family transcriptional regulator [Streptomyces sp. NBC_00264]|uniref:LacI family DNA-binding transcriptional regulator n=1 Tax=unclassified Streptomyces TaxID=2593676 RepID=UPI000F5C06B3|nr:MULTISPECIES: LacI family DNA-binding transcriptional regulator [unclassified Streptomyces]WSG53589.1 LacI family transcriptional regulator [Streptomyces sp. NBC_01732]WSX04243.1 LacI family transcriptional regulator [Streptomyces sp. NBC_00987]MCX4393685.1 LacI family transcriptional regulator [Streptomyces sp. NBC_01767]MCX5105636.1 LacI family transcriptional regulator [Streptomyces sp. NBC_00439]MCX5163217.1 LacI family transcriptional regulator [Streptomyces sp. NBC_00305]
MRVTIADVAREAGVSKTTVSRVVNAKGEVGGSTAARVREVIAQLGYVPSSGAVGLARGSSRTVGMLVPSLTWPWMGEVLQGVVDTVEAADYGLLLFTCNRGAESVRRFTGQVSARAFDGLLVVEPENTLDHLTALHRGGLPIVLIDDRGHHPEFPSVVTTNREGGASAARHLLAAGRTRPLVITGPQHFGCVRDRLDGFRAVLPTDLVVHGDFTERSGRLAVEQLIASGAGFDSVFAHNDISAAGVLRALRAAGRSVPDDIAVVGFDDIPMAEHTEPPLTTVRQPARRMGETAARLLLSHLGGTPVPEAPVVLPTELVVRHSAP